MGRRSQVSSTSGVALTADRLDAAVKEAMASAAMSDPDPAWSWRHTQDSIELHGELPPLVDPQHRRLMLTGGAALLNLRILIRGLGVHPSVRAVPDPNRRDLIAVVRLEGPRPVTADDRAMVDAVLHGVNRHPGGTGPSGITPLAMRPLLTALRRAAKVEQTWLAVQPAALQVVPIGDAAPVGDSDPAAPTLIIGTVLDGPSARLQAGQAAQRVVLTAATAGVLVRPLPAVLNLPTDRQTVRDLIGGGLWPQAALGLDVERLTPRQHPMGADASGREAR
jgi:hypothetical protein